MAFLEVVDTNLLWGVDKAYAISLSSRVPYVIGEYQEKWDFHLKPLTFIHPDYGVITSLILWSGWYVKIDTNTLTWYESSGWVVWGVNVEWWELWVADVIEIWWTNAGSINQDDISQALPVVGGVSPSSSVNDGAWGVSSWCTLTDAQVDVLNNTFWGCPTPYSGDESYWCGLTYLDASNCSLSSLPAEIGNLTNLKGLYLYDNQLSSLPAEIGNLTNLQWLSLGRNQLSSLPAEIGNLTNLKQLYLSYNQLGNLNYDFKYSDTTQLCESWVVAGGDPWATMCIKWDWSRVVATVQ